MNRTFASMLAGLGFVTGCMVMSDLTLKVDPVDPDQGSTSSGTTSGKTSSGSNGTSGQTSSGGIACQRNSVPAKPAKASTGGTDTTLTFAMQNVVSNNQSTPFGLNIDGLCTCYGTYPDGGGPPDPDACKRPTPSCDDPANVGLDNAGSTIFKGISGGGGANLADIGNTQVADGDFGLLVHIEGYNGLEDDDAITVTVIRSAGPSSGGKPNFSSKEQWSSSSETYDSTEAYVAGKVLVAKLPSVPVPFLIGTNKPAKMNGAIITGAFDAGNTLPALIVAGRSNTTELVNSVGQLNHPVYGTLCQTSDVSPLFTNFSNLACSSSDMPTDPTKDRDLTTSCDALSFGVKMQMIPADLGPDEAVPNPGEQCAGHMITCP